MAEQKDVVRTDFYEYDPSTKFTKQPDGTYKGVCIVTNIGVFKYYNADGSERFELRSPAEVFSEGTIASLRNKPVVNDHPKVLLSKSGRFDTAVGTTGEEVKTTPYHLAVEVVVKDAAAIKDIKNGKTALSLGYVCDLDEAPQGAMEFGMRYDCIQRNIRIDHLAIVSRARAGESARIHLDPVDSTQIVIDKGINEMAEPILKSVRLDGVEYSAEPKVLEALHAAQVRADAAEKQIEVVNTDKSKLEAERDNQKERADGIAKELETLKANHVDADKFAAAVKFRVGLESTAAKIGVEVRSDAADLDIMKAIIMNQKPGAKLENQNEVYIRSRFDGVCEDIVIEKIANDDAKARGVAGANHQDSDDKPVDISGAKAKYIKALQDAYKGDK